MKDVALLAVDVVQQGDAGAAVRVVLDGRDLRGDAVLVALEVDDAVTALVTAALMAGGDAAVVVASCLVGQRRKQRLLRRRRRDLGEVRDRLEASAGAGRLVLFDSHCFPFCGFSLARLSVHRESFVSSWLRLPPMCRREAGHVRLRLPRVRVYPSKSRRNRELYAENALYSRIDFLDTTCAQSAEHSRPLRERRKTRATRTKPCRSQTITKDGQQGQFPAA